MATMEEFKGKATEAAQSAARAAKYVAIVSKKRLAILNEQEKIRRNYTKLGKVYYKDYVTDEEPDEAEYRPLCEEISESFRRINTLRDEIADAKEAYSAQGASEEMPEDVPEDIPEDVEILPPVAEADVPEAETAEDEC